MKSTIKALIQQAIATPTYRCYEPNIGRHTFLFQNELTGALRVIIHVDGKHCYGKVFVPFVRSEDTGPYELEIPTFLHDMVGEGTFKVEVSQLSAYVVRETSHSVTVDFNGKREITYSKEEV